MLLDPKITAALIGAVGAIIVFMSRDLLLWVFKEGWKENRDRNKVFRNYSHPISNSLSSLLWRLDEIFNSPGRGAYLASSTQKSSFAEYKKISTAYRLAVVIGWMRAYQRELAYLRPHKGDDAERVRKAIADFESALADGASVEIKRLEGLLTVWNIRPVSDRHLFEATAIEIDKLLDNFLHEASVNSADILSASEKTELCKRVRNIIADRFGVKSPSDALLAETKVKSIQFLSYRQAWIYRDWQIGVGDHMIIRVDAGPRLYEIMGFSDFEDEYMDGNNKWIQRIVSIFDELDVTVVDQFDARQAQLRKLMEANANLLLAFAEPDGSISKMLSSTILKAKQIVSD